MRFILAITTFVALTLSSLTTSTVSAADSVGKDIPAKRSCKKPNIVFIMADDLGWSDVGFNGAKFYETPNLDRICRKGMKFTRAYSGGPNCLPTRACLISGMYTPRTQIWTPGGKSKGKLAYMKLLVPTRGQKGGNTIPSKLALKPSVTSIAEVLNAAGYKTARFGKWHVGRDTQGFDISDPSGKGARIGAKFYGNPNVHEWLTDASVKFIRENKDRPFFLYLCHWDVHSPMHSRKAYQTKFIQKKKDAKWDYNWNPTYAGMIHAVDKSVNRIYNQLDQLGLLENTVFIFISDNGGSCHYTTNRPLHGGKGALYEGGIRVPMFVVRPSVIQPNSVCGTPITSVDFLPTFADLAKAKLPTDQPVDGVSIVPLLQGKKIEPRSIFWHFPLYLSGYGESRVLPVSGTKIYYWRGVPSSALVRDNWKLIHFFEDDSTKLYDLSEEGGELRDLSKKHPKIAKQLANELRQWEKKTKAPIPTTPNPRF